MRVVVISLFSIGVAGCHVGPQLSPSAAGCYRVEADPLPEVYRSNLVPELPEMLQLDAANQGQVMVPRRWLEAQGIGMRSANLALWHPAWGLEHGRVVMNRRPQAALPPDSIALAFSGGGATLSAVLARETDGRWRGTALMWPNPSAQDIAPITMGLSPMPCSETPMGYQRGAGGG